MAAERLRKGVGEKRGDETVDKGGADSDGDQCEHVQTAVDDGRPAALKERPAAPEYHRSSKNELKPIEQLGSETVLNRLSGNQVGHGEKSDRRAKHHSCPKSPRHFDQLGIGFFFDGRRSGLERHAAEGAGAGLSTDDLRMHRTNIFCLHRRSGGSCRLQRHAAFRTRAGFGLAHLGIHRADIDSMLAYIWL